jgi:hypothetical protein
MHLRHVAVLVGLVTLFHTPRMLAQTKPRARALGVAFDGTPGKLNAITDVPGVTVGFTTLIAGEGTHAVRTGVSYAFVELQATRAA